MRTVQRHVSFVDVASNGSSYVSCELEPERLTPRSSNNSEIPPLRTRRPSAISAISSILGLQRPSITDSEMAEYQFNSALTEPIPRQHLQHFQRRFGPDINSRTLTRKDLCELIQVTPMLGERLLNIFGQRNATGTDLIPGELVVRIARLLWMSDKLVKAFIFFKLISKNDRDMITIDDIRNFYKCYLGELKYKHDNEKCEHFIDIFLRGLRIDEQEIRQLNFQQFYDILHQHPQALESLYLISIPDQDTLDEDENSRIHRVWMYVRNNLPRIVFFLIYVLTTIALAVFVIIVRVDHEKNHNGWQVTARVSGELISFHFALVITLMLREIITIIRRIRWLRRIIPVDDYIDAHRIVGGMLFFWSMVHTVSHACNYAIHTTEHTWAESMFTMAAGQGWVYHSAPITGDILFLLLLVMIIFSIQCIRQRTGCFPLFRYSHQIYWLLFVLLLIHAQDFWKWTVGPMGIFLLEKLYNIKTYFPSYGKTFLLEVTIEDENVLTLVMQRPKHFRYKPGDYVYISLPSIAFYEWHPFTLTSSPKDKNKLRIHMMKQKNWTRKVYEHFHDMYDSLQTNNEQVGIVVESNEQNSSRSSSIQKKLTFSNEQPSAVIRIRGPCSSSTFYVLDDDCSHAVLIGSGIGITPYISVLETLIHQIRSERHTCSSCGHIDQNTAVFNQRKLKKIDFIWVNRDVKNFGWFIKLLGDFEAEQERYLQDEPQRSRYLDVHLYFSALPSNEQGMMKNAPFDMVATIYKSVCQEDMYTALKTVKTIVGRPPWNLLFSQFETDQRPDQTTAIFFTGHATMGAEIKRHCDEHRFSFHHEPYF